jgi:hypothetical protein
MAAADAYSTRPTDATIRDATAQCRRGTVTPPSGIVGISDPNALDSNVIALIKDTGVKWVRAEFHWSRIQPMPNSSYNWSEYDVMVDRFNMAGIKIAAILTYIPHNMPPDWGYVDTHFQRFAAAAVQRYAPLGVHHWEIFNEPNLTGFGWLPKGLNARDFLGAYTLLLARANKVVRTHDSQGVVVLGGLASDNHGGIRSEDAMSVIYGAGARNCFDVLAFHPYGYQNRFPAARSRVNAFMSLGGDLGKPVWFNEYGWTDYSKMDMTTYKTADVNPMMAVFRQRNEANALFWFSAKDFSSRLGTPTFGLADFYLNKRKSFDTFKYLVGQSR